MLKNALVLASFLEKNEKTDFGLDIVYETVDSMLKSDMFKELDEEISEIDPKNLSTDFMLSVLISTLSAKSKLPNRKKFLEKAKSVTKEDVFHGL